VSNHEGVGLIIMRRLHRMVRHGFRPWLGYSTASGQDEDIHLRRRDQVASIFPDGSVHFVFKVTLAHRRPDRDGNIRDESFAIMGDDSENFDALFPADAIPKRPSVARRLYEFGF
jgi:hypothetical protein